MKSRVISALIALPVFFLVIYFGKDILYYTSIVVGIALIYELHRMIYKKDNLHIFLVSIVFLILSFIATRYNTSLTNYLLPLYIFVILSMSTILKDTFELTNVSVYITFTIYTIILMPYLYMLDKFSSFIVFLPFLSGWAYDTCAYLSGITFGKNRPWKNLSPKKSIEGLIGGSVASIIIVMIYGNYLNLNLLYLLIYAILAVIIAQAGDLLISALKRFTNVKDSGKIMPGHGGLFDRFDSVMPLFALAYFFATNYL